MSISKSFIILLTAVMWMKSVCLQTPQTVEKLERRFRRYTNSENCGIRLTLRSQQGAVNNSVGDSLQEGDGIVKSNLTQSQIIGGQTSTSKWPWMATLLQSYDNSKVLAYHSCGGTAIDERHIISAAHCFAPKNDPRDWTVQVGELSYSFTSPSYKVEELKIHEGYTGPREDFNDIAILRLASPLPSDIVPACLPMEDSVREGDFVTVLGWGQMHQGGATVQDLQEIHDVKIISKARCDAIITSDHRAKHLREGQFCSDGGKGSCRGDSGGPVLFQNNRGQYEIVGLVSYGFGCGTPGYPKVYTKVYSYLQWIQNFIKNRK